MFTVPNLTSEAVNSIAVVLGECGVKRYSAASMDIHVEREKELSLIHI